MIIDNFSDREIANFLEHIIKRNRKDVKIEKIEEVVDMPAGIPEVHAPTEKSPISARCDRIQNALDELEGAIEHLRVRISPILTERLPESKTGEEIGPASTELESRLAEMQGRLTFLVLHVNDIRDKVAL